MTQYNIHLSHIRYKSKAQSNIAQVYDAYIYSLQIGVYISHTKSKILTIISYLNVLQQRIKMAYPNRLHPNKVLLLLHRHCQCRMRR